MQAPASPLTGTQQQQQQQFTKLLLVFRRNLTFETFSLVNSPGLPISNACPFLRAGEKLSQASAGLITAVTGVIAATTTTTTTAAAAGEERVYKGYSFLMSWVSDDNTHSFVVLEKDSSTAAGQDIDMDQAKREFYENSNNNNNNQWTSTPAPSGMNRHRPDRDLSDDIYDEWSAPIVPVIADNDSSRGS